MGDVRIPASLAEWPQDNNEKNKSIHIAAVATAALVPLVLLLHTFSASPLPWVSAGKLGKVLVCSGNR